MHFYLGREYSLLLSGFPVTSPRNHNHPQLGASTPTDGGVKGLPWKGDIGPHGGPERGSSECRTTVVHGMSFRLRVTLFLMPWRVHPSWYVGRLDPAAFHATVSAQNCTVRLAANSPSIRTRVQTQRRGMVARRVGRCSATLHGLPSSNPACQLRSTVHRAQHHPDNMRRRRH